MNRHDRRRHERLNRKEKPVVNGVPMLGQKFGIQHQITQSPFADTQTIPIQTPNGVLLQTLGGMPLIHEAVAEVAGAV